MPFTFEDRTGDLHRSDFDDIYDRMFLRITPYPHVTSGNKNTLAVYVMGCRSTRRKDTRHLDRHPSVLLEFGETRPGLGTIYFTQSPSSSIPIPMHNYLRKTTFFGGSLSRKFRASDGREYKWQHKSIDGHEWTCLSAEGYMVAHYDLRPPSIAVYGVSGNTLTIHEAYSNLCVDILASLTIMRYIAEHGL
ncbi:hypothetical protein BKA82DRAFT_15046 [Pisolithus tinctorius]|uniref:DUF6593 domain-containing protein n=1 Tax=Pisolithus tinctorius Marx 270 TaxID=870435 RepID=A0A0C3PF24_PISTI|nr:hypothetical protein BKA82DRAFT_15046 [Pisolithus tinctorius]KIO06831.1 hypothetical protein M404DRAFT_15046 [Pisolithus tinctorius Marx 270]